MRGWLKGLAVLLLAGLAGLWFWAGEVEAPSPAGPRPNVVIIVLDAARADHFGCYGYALPTTPTIDELAARSLVMERAWAVSPHTLPSTASLFTSLYPDSHDVLSLESRLSEQIPTWAEQFASHGYRTLLVANNPSFHPTFGLTRGFQVVRWVDSVEEDRSQRLTEQVLEELGKVQEPFLLYVHYLRPHVPYDAPEAIRALFGREGRSWFTDNQAINRGEVPLTPQLLEGMKGDYDASLRTADGEVGRLLDELRGRGVLADTVLVLTSDHGEAFGEHGMVDHVWTVYEEMIRIPLIFYYPPALEAARSSALAQTVDIFPTLAHLVGVPPLAHSQGESLLGRSRSRAFARSLGEPPQFAVRSVTRKLVLKENGRIEEFYDLERDPGERRPLSRQEVQGEYAREWNELRSSLQRWLAFCLQNRVGSSPAQLDRELIERLKSLGYLQ